MDIGVVDFVLPGRYASQGIYIEVAARFRASDATHRIAERSISITYFVDARRNISSDDLLPGSKYVPIVVESGDPLCGFELRQAVPHDLLAVLGVDVVT